MADLTSIQTRLILAARELEALMGENELSDPLGTLTWATERNAAVGFAGYDGDRRVVQVRLSHEELFLVVGLAVALHSDPAFYEAFLGPEDDR